MKRKEEFIQLLADQIRCKRAREDVIREMEAHISDQAEAYEAEGMEPEEALAAAATVLSALRACSAGLRTSTAAGRQGPLPGLRNNET